MPADALSVAIDLAREHGVRSADPRLLSNGTSFLFDLGPVVARAGTPRTGAVASVAVAAHAAARGAAVVPPATILPPGPHVRDGFVVTFWTKVEVRGRAEPEDAGRLLRDLHEALVDYDGALPPAGHTADVAALLDRLPPSADVELLRAHLEAGPVAGQALHGDTYVGNCLLTSAGPRWSDFEHVCRGPRESDLASLVFVDRVHGPHEGARRALAAYGDHDEELLERCLVQQAVFLGALLLELSPGSAEARQRLDWLRRSPSPA